MLGPPSIHIKGKRQERAFIIINIKTKHKDETKKNINKRRCFLQIHEIVYRDFSMHYQIMRES